MATRSESIRCILSESASCDAYMLAHIVSPPNSGATTHRRIDASGGSVREGRVGVPLCLLINPCALKTLEFCADRFIVAGMLTILSAIVSLVSFRFRRRASLELEVLALRHQVAVLHRQRPGRAWLGRGDRLLWAWLYRAWPHCLKIMGLVKPATVIQWAQQGFRRYWCWRSTSGRVGEGGSTLGFAP